MVTYSIALILVKGTVQLLAPADLQRAEAPVERPNMDLLGLLQTN